jgi:hypothetical protein
MCKNKEISDGMKADLEKVICDNYNCLDRGEFPRCYLDVYRFCSKYDPKPCKLEREKRECEKK